MAAAGARPSSSSDTLDTSRDVVRPIGRNAVRTALIEATIELIVKKGLSMSVREIAARADVNHGLVHTYFGGKDGLITTAFDTISQRGVDELDERGFPPTDLAERRGGEIAKALARAMLDDPTIPFSSHPIISSWRTALAAERPDLERDDLDQRVLIATALALSLSEPLGFTVSSLR